MTTSKIFIQIKNKAIKTYLYDVLWWLCADQSGGTMLKNNPMLLFAKAF